MGLGEDPGGSGDGRGSGWGSGLDGPLDPEGVVPLPHEDRVSPNLFVRWGGADRTVSRRLHREDATGFDHREERTSSTVPI